MEQKENIKTRIIKSTISLLAREGADKFSMRKVAKETNISLGNLQYHYKDKEVLIEETVGYYFESCSVEVSENMDKHRVEESLSKSVFIENLLTMLLIDDNMNEQIIMFREILALSNRSEQLKKVVYNYYHDYMIWLKTLLSEHFNNPDSVVHFLLPYIEGYPIVHQIIPANKKETIAFLKTILMTFD